MARVGTVGLQDELLLQRDFLRDRVPVYARLIDLILESLPGSLGKLLEAQWGARAFTAWYERPMLLLASLRNDALREGALHPLWAAIGAEKPEVRAATAVALAAALSPDRHTLHHSLRSRYVQTNETSRAVAWLLPAHWYALADPRRPLALADIGTSAGLNLVADRLPSIWERDDRTPLRLEPRPPIVARTGFDQRPLDILDQDHARWLRACVWPGDRARLERLTGAIAAFRNLAGDATRPTVVTCTAAEVPDRLPRPSEDEPRVIAFQTIMRDYLSADERIAYRAGMERWLRECVPGAALWMELEVAADPARGPDPVELTGHVRGRGGDLVSFVVATTEPHPRVLRLLPAAAELRQALGAA
jgi:hypothetical protein